MRAYVFVEQHHEVARFVVGLVQSAPSASRWFTQCFDLVATFVDVSRRARVAEGGGGLLEQSSVNICGELAESRDGPLGLVSSGVPEELPEAPMRNVQTQHQDAQRCTLGFRGLFPTKQVVPQTVSEDVGVFLAEDTVQTGRVRQRRPGLESGVEQTTSHGVDALRPGEPVDQVERREEELAEARILHGQLFGEGKVAIELPVQQRRERPIGDRLPSLCILDSSPTGHKWPGTLWTLMDNEALQQDAGVQLGLRVGRSEPLVDLVCDVRGELTGHV